MNTNIMQARIHFAEFLAEKSGITHDHARAMGLRFGAAKEYALASEWCFLASLLCADTAQGFAVASMGATYAAKAMEEQVKQNVH